MRNAFAEKQNTISTQLEDMGLSQLSEQYRSATETAKFQGQQNVEGAMGSGQSQFSNIYSQQAAQSMEKAVMQVTAERNRRAELERQRAVAQDEGEAGLAAEFEREIRNSEIKERTLLANAQASLTTAQTEQQKTAQTQLEYLNTLPASVVANIPTEEISSLFVARGYSAYFGGAFKNASAEIALAEEVAKKR